MQNKKKSLDVCWSNKSTLRMLHVSLVWVDFNSESSYIFDIHIENDKSTVENIATSF